MITIRRVLFLVLGLALSMSVAPSVQAADLVEASPAATDCLVEGPVDLRIIGTERMGSVDGWIGSHRFYGRINNGRLSGTVGPISFYNLFVDTISREDVMISGWIGQTRVSWRSFGRWISAGSVCLN